MVSSPSRKRPIAPHQPHYNLYLMTIICRLANCFLSMALIFSHKTVKRSEDCGDTEIWELSIIETTATSDPFK